MIPVKFSHSILAHQQPQMAEVLIKIGIFGFQFVESLEQ